MLAIRTTLTVIFMFTLMNARSAVCSETAGFAFKVLKDHCADCHGSVNPIANLAILDHSQLLETSAVSAGSIEDSEIWARITSSDENYQMPPGDPLSNAQRAMIKKWITEGAKPFPAIDDPDRERILLDDCYAQILQDLRGIPAENRADQRYFSLIHLANNPAITDRDLALFRAALAKLINSLSWQADIYHPVAINDSQTVYRVDLAQLDWDLNGQWGALLKQYPYGVSHGQGNARQTAIEIYELTGTQVPIIRADWFVSKASQPPLYHSMLQLPNTQAALELKLGVNRARDFNKNRQATAAFNKSNVSKNNRQVQRHRSQFGYYWLSHDFKSSVGVSNILSHPLGPNFADNSFSRFAFEHDGGEIVFSLPNGLQGYMIVDAAGKRIDTAPTEVVFNSKQTLGRIEVINGVACIACHVRGMQTFRDDVLENHGLTGRAREKVELLYPTQAIMDQIVENDARAFVSALEESIGRYIAGMHASPMSADEVAEPIGAISRQYTQSLSWNDVVAELLCNDTGRVYEMYENGSLADLFQNNPQLRSLGLSVLPSGGVINRDMWEGIPSQPGVYSLFQEVTMTLGLGSPEKAF